MLRFNPYFLAFCLLLLPCAPAARGEVPWLQSIDQARQVAGQTKRLVLVHFWSKDCQPCMRMEQSVFAKPGTAERIQTRFVPVKVDSQQFPAVARQYDVTFLPCDVVLAPNGQVVALLRCSLDQETYLAGLDQVAIAADPRLNNAYSSLGTPPTAVLPGAAAPGIAAGLPAAGAAPTPPPVAPDDRYAEFYRQRQQPVPGAPAPQPSGIPSAATPPVATLQPPQVQPGLDRVAGSVGMPGQENRYGAPTPQVPTMPPLVAPGTPSAPTLAPQTSAPLAMDGYCTVELAERERWVPGDRKFGAVHRGQTYLFSGPEQQKRFLANPDRYGLAMSGHDPVLALEKRELVPGVRKYGLYYNNRIYLFSSEATLTQFWSAAARYADGVRLAEAGGPVVR